eukprot:6474331-Pyramimonas_sp.AAC.1
MPPTPPPPQAARYARTGSVPPPPVPVQNTSNGALPPNSINNQMDDIRSTIISLANKQAEQDKQRR